MKKSLVFRGLVLGATLLFMLTLGVSSASALSFELTSDHCGGGGANGCLPNTGFTSGGTVTVMDLGGGSLSFNVVMNTGFDIVNTGFPLSFAFNLNGDPTVTFSGLTVGFSIPGGSSPQQSAGTYSQDGTGTFEYGVLWGQQGGGHGSPGPLSFTITAAGLTLASLQQNSDGQYFAVDVLSPNGKTGNIDGSTPSVPDGGSTMTLLGSVLLGLGMMRRRFSKN